MNNPTIRQLCTLFLLDKNALTGPLLRRRLRRLGFPQSDAGFSQNMKRLIGHGYVVGEYSVVEEGGRKKREKVFHITRAGSAFVTKSIDTLQLLSMTCKLDGQNDRSRDTSEPQVLAPQDPAGSLTTMKKSPVRRRPSPLPPSDQGYVSTLDLRELGGYQDAYEENFHRENAAVAAS